MKKKKKITKKKKKKKVSIKKDSTTAKGLFFLSLTILLLFSLLSFSAASPQKNYLGNVGYFFAWGMNYLFGLCSYLIFFFLLWTGWHFVKKKKIFPAHIIYFSIFILSSCFLLNAFAEIYPMKAIFLEKKVITEAFLSSHPWPHTTYRINLGGIPFYYLYKDFPYLNIQNLLSNKGTVLLFSLSSIVSFILLLGTHLVAFLKHFLKFSYLILKTFYSCSFFLLKKTKQFSFHLLHSCSLYFQKMLETKKNRHLKKNVKRLSSIRKTVKESHSLEDISSTLDKKINTLPPPKISKNTSNDKLSKFIKKSQNNIKKIEKKPIFPQFLSYRPPPFSLLSNPPIIDQPLIKKELRKQAEILEQTLKNFSIEAKVGDINCGPTITSFEVHPSIGVKVQKIKALENDLALNLQAKSIRIIAPIPGKAAVGVEVPSLYPQEVSLKEMLFHYEEKKKKHTIPLLLGKNVTGEYISADLTKMPHLLIAGATGAGKSVCINTIVMSILMNAGPEEVKLLMIDPKKVELTQYSRLPHMIAPVITEPHGAYAALHWLVKEMHKRYDILKQLSLRNITAFNNRKINKELEASLTFPIPERMPLFVAIMDEFADLMMVSSTDLETPIARIAQMARAVGIHLILATQRPSREVITGIIKANFPSRIAFKVASRINSQIILDESGAESLLGNGDLLFLPPGSSHLVRAQGAYISDEDINHTISHICKKTSPNYLIPSFDAMKEEEFIQEPTGGRDKLYKQALSLVLETNNASTTFLQRKLKIGYARAAGLMDELEENGIIGPPDGSRPRKILSSKEYKNFL